MSPFGGRRRAALLAAGVLAATVAALAPGYAAGEPRIDRDAVDSWGWFPTNCDTDATTDDMPVPTVGPVNVPSGAGSLDVWVSDDVAGEFDLPQVRSAADLTSYGVTLQSPTPVVHFLASLQFGATMKYLMATVSVPSGQWQKLDLTTITWVHVASNRIRFWGEDPDDSGNLAHFVGGTGGVDFRPALMVLGCDRSGGIGQQRVFLDTSEIVTTDATEPNAGTIDHEPATAPTPSVSTAPDRTITYGRQTTLSTTMTYGDSWPLADQTWALESAAPGADVWGAIAMDATTADGGAQWTVKPVHNTSYRWFHPRDASGYFAEATSGRTEVIVRSSVRSKPVTGTVHRGRMVKVTGSVGPVPPTGTSITLWRWGTRHVRLEQATVGDTGRYAFATKATKAGTLPLRVTIDATPTNGAGRGRIMKVHVTR